MTTHWVVSEIKKTGDYPVGVYTNQVKAIKKRDTFGAEGAFITRVETQE